MAFKKVMSAVMAGAMALSLGMTAFASSTSSGVTLEGELGYELGVEGTTTVPTIKVVVPETAGVIANPYRMTVDAQGIGGTATENGQIISPVQYVKNLSLVDVDVKTSAAGWVGGELTFGTFTAGTEKGKKADVSIEIGLCDGTAAATSPTTAKLAATETPTQVGTTLLTMAKSDGATVASTGALSFQFTGTMNDAPETPWTEEDTFGATLVFEFTAKANAAGGSATPTPTP